MPSALRLFRSGSLSDGRGALLPVRRQIGRTRDGDTPSPRKPVGARIRVERSRKVQQQLDVDHDTAYRARLASENVAVLFVVWGKGSGAILLDVAFEERDLAGTALAGAA